MSRPLIRVSGSPALLARLPLTQQQPPPPTPQKAKSSMAKNRRRARSQAVSPAAAAENAFADVWPWYEAQAAEVLAESNAEICTAVADFLEDSRHGGQRMPFAVLHAGVNTPDRDAMLTCLTDRLVRDGACRVARVDAEDLASYRQLVARALGQWMPKELEAAGGGGGCDGARLSLMRAADIYEQRLLPTATSSGSGRQPLLVLLIGDYDEVTSGKALDKFVQVCGNYTGRLPVGFVCGLSKTPASLQDLLAAGGAGSALARLSVSCFQSAPAGKLFDKVLDRVLIRCRQHPYRLSQAALDQLVEAFNTSEFSVAGFMSRLKLLLLEHICSPEAALAGTPPPRGHLRLQRAVPLAMAVLEPLLGFRSHSGLYSLMLGARQHLCDTAEWAERLAELLESPTEAVRARLGASRRRLRLAEGQDDGDDDDEDTRQLRDAWTAELDGLDDLLELRLAEVRAAEAAGGDVGGGFQATDSSSPVAAGSDHCQLTRQLQRLHLQAAVNRRADLRGLGAGLRSRVADSLERRLRADLPTPDSAEPSDGVSWLAVYAQCPQRLADAFSADVTGQLDRRLVAAEAPGAADCPDMALVRRLVGEAGRVVNLRDLVRAFAVCRRRSDDDLGEDVGDCQLLTPELQSRCLLACAEMQLLGYTRTTRSRPDHMIRLTTG